MITFERNRYSVLALFANRPVSLLIYPGRLIVEAEGNILCEHPQIKNAVTTNRHGRFTTGGITLPLSNASLVPCAMAHPSWNCRWASGQAPAPARLIEGGIPTEANVTQVLVSKYANHLPLYRQAQIYKRQGIDLDRSTLTDWVGRAAWHLRPVHQRLLDHLKSSSRLFADETTAPVLDPVRGKTKTGQLWAYARDDSPWQGEDPPGVAYVYAPDRKGERPMAHLDGFVGILQVDGYSGYRPLAAKDTVSLAFCWSHVRCRFYELAAAGPAPIASEALKRSAELYKIEDEIRGLIRGA